MTALLLKLAGGSIFLAAATWAYKKYIPAIEKDAVDAALSKAFDFSNDPDDKELLRQVVIWAEKKYLGSGRGAEKMEAVKKKLELMVPGIASYDTQLTKAIEDLAATVDAEFKAKIQAEAPKPSA